MKKIIVLLACLVFCSCNNRPQTNDRLNLESNLSGQWMAAAFDGELHEQWTLNQDGWMQQEGYYIEKSDTLYAAKTQIQKVDDKMILFSIIENSNPKIFQSVQTQSNKIIFENKDYKNPYRVTYEFLTESSYRRTIEGQENDSLVIYVFDFKKLN